MNTNNSERLTIGQAAEYLEVSKATIRNWIKLGYLASSEKNLLSKSSLDIFFGEFIGKSKLNSRANKLHKLQHAELIPFDIDRWQDYESSLSEAHRNREGVYYTPSAIAADMVLKIGKINSKDATILDPCCGSGNFLIQAIKMGVAPQNIYGYDIDPNAVEITKRRIEEMTGYTSESIICADYLQIADSLDLKFDFIITNPPWGKKIPRATREKISVKYGATKCVDSSSLFLLASLPLLKKNGTLGFLLQEAFFNISSYAEVRRKLLDYKITHLVDYGKAFKSLATRAQAIIIKNCKARSNNSIKCYITNNWHKRSTRSFVCNPFSIINFRTNSKESRVIEKILSSNYTTLSGTASWGLGIVTGDNRRLCSRDPKQGYIAIYRGADITPYGFKEPQLYIDKDLSLYQQVAPAWLYDAPCKIVYKFISSRLCFVCDMEQRLLLNSANMLVLDKNYPISANEMVRFLNSDFTNWVFKKLFHTHKILRRDLEQLPIYMEFFDNGRFCEQKYLKGLKIRKDDEGSYELIE